METIEPMNDDDLQMLRLIDSYTPERQQERANAVHNCGIEPQRLAMYNVGALALTAVESELMTQALLQ